MDIFLIIILFIIFLKPLYKLVNFLIVNYRQSKVGVVLEYYLAHPKNMGKMTPEIQDLIVDIVTAAWEEKPDIFNGRWGKHPSPMTAALYAVSFALSKQDIKYKTNLFWALYNIGNEIELNWVLYNFNNVDIALIALSEELFLHDKSQVTDKTG